MAEEELLTGKELAAKLKWAFHTVKHKGQSGEIPRLKLGSRTIRYRLSDVLKHLTSTVPDKAMARARQLQKPGRKGANHG